MTSEQLAYLIEISRSPSLNIASQKLNLTPQALGSSIKLLEDELHLKLLERTHRGSYLTAEGMKLVRLALFFFDGIQDIYASSQKQVDQALIGQLTIASSYSCINGFLPHLICTLYKSAPQFRLKIAKYTQKALYESILTGAHELGIVYQTRIDGHFLMPPDDRLEFQPIFKCQIIAQMTNRFPIAFQKSVSIATLLQYPLLLHAADQEENASLYELIRSFGSPLRIEQENNLPLFKEMVNEGIGVAILLMYPSVHQSLTFFDNLPVVPINDDIEIFLGTIQVKGRPLSPLAQKFMHYIDQFLQRTTIFDPHSAE